MNTEQDIAVVICAYTERRWQNLINAIESVHQQTLQAHELVVVIDHNPMLLKQAQERFPKVSIIENAEERGVSGSRNTGMRHTQSPLIAFLDDDAVANPDWLEELRTGLQDSRILGVGGEIIPYWSGKKQPWFPEEFLWVVGCTYRGMPQQEQAIRNLIGANMALKREVFDGVGGFHTAIGRLGTIPIGCEETELCIRASKHWPKRYFLYKPSAKVEHYVPDTRVTWDYFWRRCYAEGQSKALVAKLVGRQDALATEQAYVLNVLPRGVLQGIIHSIIQRDRTGIARARAIIAGLTLTSIGYVVGTIKLTLGGKRLKIPSTQVPPTQSFSSSTTSITSTKS